MSKPSLLRALTYLGVLFLGMVVGVLGLIYVLAGDIYEYQDSVDVSHLPTVDAIVCLAGGRGRITAAGDLWYDYWKKAEGGRTPILYLSGMGHQSHWPVLAKQLRPGVHDVIRPDNVVLENESSNTETNAVWLARRARREGWARILLMTSSYHMKRARLIFDRVLNRGSSQPVEIETLSVHQEPFGPKDWRSSFQGVRVTMFEYLKWIYYRYF